jgi:N-acetylneuraminic acid mutarotase
MKLFYLLTCFFALSIFIIGQDYWESLAPMPTPRYSLAMEEVHGKLYAIGGHNNGQTLNVVEEYDIENNSWTTKTPLPAIRQFPASVVLNGKIIVIAGKLGNSVTNTVVAYDPVVDTWSALAPLNNPRAYPSAVIYNDQIYVFGGDDPSNNSISEVEKYDPLSNTWSVISDMTVPRRAMGTTIIGSKVYLIGGTANTINYKRVDVYDIDLNSWSLGPDKLMEGRAIGVESIGNYIFAIGGLIQPPPYAQVEMFDIASGLWTIRTSMPSGRSDFGNAVYNNEIYVVGGYPGNVVALNEVLKYHPDESFISLVFDIKPQSCPNPLNVKSKGKIPVAILGMSDFDVLDVDPATVLFEGVSPIRWAIEDVTKPVAGGEQCDCTTDGPDGFDDLTLKFDTQELIAALGSVNNGDELILTITGNLSDGTPIEGSDCVIIKAKSKLGRELTGNSSQVPEEYSLYENFPDPFNPSTSIKFDVPEQSFIKLEVYNSLGERVTTLIAETLAAGIYAVNWNAADLPSGVYIYSIQSKDFFESKKMILLK